MSRISGLLSTSIGQKLVLAASGVALVGFLLAHMAGNLTLFQGREVMNTYAAWLQGHPLLWAARIGLLAVFVVHTSLALKLAWSNHRARPRRYAHGSAPQESTIASRYIALTGLLVLSFLVYHLLHFTFRDAEQAAMVDAQGRHDVYGMLVAGFSEPSVAITYLVAMVILGFHLRHGLRSLFQTFGLHHDNYRGLIHATTSGLAAVIVLGNSAIPLSVWLGWIQP